MAWRTNDNGTCAAFPCTDDEAALGDECSEEDGGEEREESRLVEGERIEMGEARSREHKPPPHRRAIACCSIAAEDHERSGLSGDGETRLETV